MDQRKCCSEDVAERKVSSVYVIVRKFYVDIAEKKIAL